MHFPILETDYGFGKCGIVRFWKCNQIRSCWVELASSRFTTESLSTEYITSINTLKRYLSGPQLSVWRKLLKIASHFLIKYLIIYSNDAILYFSKLISCHSLTCTKLFSQSLFSNTDDDEIEPGNKAVREKERRQANNVRERYVKNY